MTTNDLPPLAKAMTGYFRGLASVTRGDSNGVLYVRFTGSGLNVVVRADDWAKIVPYLKDQQLDPDIYPVVTAHTSKKLDLSDIDTSDPELYGRILSVLQQLFTESFPTPKY